eukprot:m.164414 g.164414  ORF g.164414 m.164414 type:complete len:131 (-) comp16408_c0_seq2:1644-2036(-)
MREYTDTQRSETECCMVKQSGHGLFVSSYMSIDGSEYFSSTEAEALDVLNLICLAYPEGITVPDKHGLTPLHLAAMHGHLGHVKRLLDLGAQPSAVDKKGRTAADLAMSRKYNDIAEYLQQHQSSLSTNT